MCFVQLWNFHIYPRLIILTYSLVIRIDFHSLTELQQREAQIAEVQLAIEEIEFRIVQYYESQESSESDRKKRLEIEALLAPISDR
jgi:hypothetical protein